GIEVDFKNTVILLTSNIGTDEIMRAGSNGGADPDALVELVRPELLKHFKPAFLGRLVVIPYLPLGDPEIREIVRLKLGKIVKRFRENHRAELVIDDRLIATIAARCTEVDSGARNIDHILTQTLLPELSERILERMATESPFWSVRIGIDDADGFLYHFVPPAPAPMLADKQISPIAEEPA
ncbi:MAG: AAA family ATPase, partial [Candidatus Kapaibacterium sp.]